MKKVYVLMYVLNEGNTKMVGLLKKKGLSYLIGKLTVPGGKSEGNEDIFQTATREVKEECGLNVSDWKLFDTVIAPDYDYHKVYSTGNDISKVKQMEIEPVFLMNIQEHLERSKINPEIYTPDFEENIQKLLSDLNYDKKLKI